jgi:hypothetical protein
MYDDQASVRAWMRYLDDFDPEYFNGPDISSGGRFLDALEMDQYRWPGRGIPADSSYQYVEARWMKADEYPALIHDPTDFWIRTYLPRICRGLRGLSGLQPLVELFELPAWMPNLAGWGRPEVQEALRSLMEAGSAARERMGRLNEFMNRAKAKGYVTTRGGMAKAPFDVLGDTLRGTVAIARDLYLRPEAVREAAQRLAPLMIRMGVNTAQRAGHPLVFMPLHKGDDDFMSDRQFRELYWPSLKTVLLGLIQEGCAPLLFIEGRYNRRLEFLQELPPGAVICHFDRTDLDLACQKMEGTACVAGGVPMSLLMFSGPEEVESHCRETIQRHGSRGGFILTNGAVLDNCPPENIKAMIRSNRTGSG